MSEREELVSIVISQNEWAHWDDLEIHLALDNHASVGFSAPFEHERKEFRSAFKPLSFQPLELDVSGTRLFTGTLVDVSPRLEASPRTVSANAYSKPAKLGEVDVPVSALPIEANGMTLMQIAQRLLEPYGFTAVLGDGVDDGAAFKRVKTRRKTINTNVEADEKIDDFLVELAKQRGLIRSSTAQGELLFTKSVSVGRPVVRLEEGQAPLMSAVPTFSPQSYFNEITGFTATKRGRVGAKYTERVNRLAGGDLRAFSFRLNDVEKADAPTAVKAKIGRMLGNVFSVVVEVPTWRNPDGGLWKPNTTVVLKAPGAMIYNDYEFLVRDVFLKQNAKQHTATLGLVLPGAFSGEVPTSLPWDEA
jgi:prophage tail gpP-like protein